MSCKVTYDTFESMVTERIYNSLSNEEFRELNENTTQWNELYLKFFLSIYLQICELPGITFIQHTKIAVEPVTLHIDVRSNINNSQPPPIVHCISIPFMIKAFNAKSYKTISNSSNCSFKLPSIFPIMYDSVNEHVTDGETIKSNVSSRLMLYYVIADHAAYHYKQFIKTGDADYKHNNIINRSSNIKPGDVVHCHDIITLKPNKNLKYYVQNHDILKVDNKTSNRPYAKYEDLIHYESDESD
ncbi:hypothetical protein CsNV_039 [Callinectes sapidus nudivirus]|nr:hypothetical protein CsNV_039 [Callinectes sapidus nudivirus]